MSSSYLVNSFTFLATLLLLLAISIAIVIRSFIIRRRFQRQVQEALAQGLVPPSPPGGAGSRRWDIGEKPILWDTHLYPEAYDTRWSKMMVCAYHAIAFVQIGRLSDPFYYKARLC